MNLTIIPEEKMTYPHIVAKLREEYKFNQIFSDVGCTFSDEFLASDDLTKNPVDTLYIPLYNGYVKEELVGTPFINLSQMRDLYNLVERTKEIETDHGFWTLMVWQRKTKKEIETIKERNAVTTREQLNAFNEKQHIEKNLKIKKVASKYDDKGQTYASNAPMLLNRKKYKFLSDKEFTSRKIKD